MGLGYKVIRNVLVLLISLISLIATSESAIATQYDPSWGYIQGSLTSSSPTSKQTFSLPGTHYYQAYEITGIPDSTTVQIYLRGQGTFNSTALGIPDTYMFVINKSTGAVVAQDDDSGSGSIGGAYTPSPIRDSYLSLTWNSNYEIQATTYQVNTTGNFVVFASAGTLGPSSPLASSVTLTANQTISSKRQLVQLTATASKPGTVTFKQKNSIIPGCNNLPTSGSPIVAICNWKPTIHGLQYLSAKLTPTDTNYPSSTGSLTYIVSTRLSPR